MSAGGEVAGGNQSDQQSDVLPASNAEYQSLEYWNERFETEESYDWFGGYERFGPTLVPILDGELSRLHTAPDGADDAAHPARSALKIMVVGCGNSLLSPSLADEGFTSIVSTDFSPVVVAKMRERFPELEWAVADMMDLAAYDDGSFDLVLEKGAMDALLVEADVWEPSDEVRERASAVLRAAHRVLRPDGTFVSITFGQPHFRARYFRSPGFTWDVETKTYGDGFDYFVYTLRKGRAAYETDEIAEAVAAAALARAEVEQALQRPTSSEDEDFLLGIGGMSDSDS